MLGRWFRGSRADYDDWGDVVHDRRWSYDGQLPYFKMTEKLYKDENTKRHGQDGRMQIECSIFTNRIYPFADITEQDWQELGVKKLPENNINVGTNLGLGELNENRFKGARQIVLLSYSLDDATVMIDTFVGFIIIDDKNCATGICLTDGTNIQSSQVIIAAGAYRTPQLFMFSGLGPKETLVKHGVETKVDIPKSVKTSTITSGRT